MQRSFVALIYDDDYRQIMNKEYLGMGKKIWKEKWMNTKCGNIKCNNKRIDVRLYKCKRCKIIRYCSKHCQKVDWNRFGHKRDCGQLRKLSKYAKKDRLNYK